MKDTDAMLWFGGHWWWFPGAQISADSEFKWRDNRVFLMEPDGTTVEGIRFCYTAPAGWHQSDQFG